MQIEMHIKKQIEMWIKQDQETETRENNSHLMS